MNLNSKNSRVLILRLIIPPRHGKKEGRNINNIEPQGFRLRPQMQFAKSPVAIGKQYLYIYTTFLPMELKVADSTRGLAACVARPLHWVSVVLLASPQHFFSRPLTEAPVSWRWRSPDQLAQHGWFVWFLLFRLRSLWSGGLRSCKQEGCKGYTPV